ncbi:Aspartic proteinase-like protein 2 [Hordeum vulgare]|nr:Aspartic proteinase-like protein 2 [Hordeum vulgare]
MRPSGLAAVVVMVLLATAAPAMNPTLVLERVVPLNGVPLGHLMELDRARQARMGVLSGMAGRLVLLLQHRWYTGPASTPWKLAALTASSSPPLSQIPPSCVISELTWLIAKL